VPGKYPEKESEAERSAVKIIKILKYGKENYN